MRAETTNSSPVRSGVIVLAAVIAAGLSAQGAGWGGPLVASGGGAALVIAGILRGRDGSLEPAVSLQIAGGLLTPVLATLITKNAVPLCFMAIPILLQHQHHGNRGMIGGTISLLVGLGMLAAYGDLMAFSIATSMMLLSLIGLRPQPVADRAPIAAAPANRPATQWVNEAQLMERMGGNRALIGELNRLLIEENRRRFASLRQAIAQADGQRISREAHGIKSGLTNFCAPEVEKLAHQLEHASQDGVTTNLSDLTDELERRIHELTEQLTAMETAA